MTPSKPVFVIAPGAWHPFSTFAPTSDILVKHGYGVRGLDFVSGSDQTIQDFEPDVERVREAVAEQLNAGKDVVLVMHSYGGVPGAEAMKHFAHDNEGKNGRGRVVRMVWVTAFCLPPTVSLMDALGGKDLPWFAIDGDVVNPENPKDVFYNDLSADDADKITKTLTPHAYRTFYSKMTFDPLPTIPSTFVLCEKDNAIPIAVQEGMVAGAQSRASNAFDIVERLPTSHTPFASSGQPEKLAGMLIKAAGGV